MKIIHGTIITCDENNNIANYLVENHGRIEYVGNDLPSKYEGFEIHELNEQALLPSFVDTHMHFASYATFHAGLNVMDARSNIEILEMLKNYIQTCKDKLILGFGASPYSVIEKRLVTRKELDDVCSHKPIFMIKYDGHACVVNTCLLNKVKNKIKHLRGYNEETGEMNQEAFFVVSNYVTNSISIPKLLKNMKTCVDDLIQSGITMVHTVSGVGFLLDADVDLERGFSKFLKNGFQLRVFMQTMNVKKALRRKLTRIGGCFENALDGCFGSADAALKQPYELSNHTGVLYYSDEQVIDFCKKANRAGLQIELHAIGDAAFDQAVKGLQAALDDTYRKDHRHTIIHACLPSDWGIKICRIYNIQLAIQSAFIDWAQEPDEFLESILGERSKKLNPFKDYVDAEILLSAGSDAPCTKPNPIEWIHKLCNHGNQSISLKDALRIVTYNGAYQTFDEKERGSLERGKIADMIVLSKNPFDIPINQLNTLQVKEVYLQGKKYK